MDYSNWIWRVILIVNLYFLNQIECVLNGIKVKDLSQFKYVVGLQVEFEAAANFCGGGILNDFMILTAAHCLVNGKDENELPEKVKIRLHSSKNRDSMLQMKRYAEEIFLPTSYVQGNIDDDIAIIKVKKSMNLLRNPGKLQKLKLPQENYRADGDKAVLAAYGVYEFDNDDPITDGRLRSLDVRVVPNHRCPTNKLQASTTHICAKPSPVVPNYPQGMCMGDSGSPLVSEISGKLVVIGVASQVESGLDCDNKNANGFYTKVSKFVSWINNVLKGRLDDTILNKVMPDAGSCFW